MTDKKLIKILMVDDHEMILEGYKNVFSNISSENKDLKLIISQKTIKNLKN